MRNCEKSMEAHTYRANKRMDVMAHEKSQRWHLSPSQIYMHPPFGSAEPIGTEYKSTYNCRNGKMRTEQSMQFH